jgi:hypothetical protein
MFDARIPPYFILYKDEISLSWMQGHQDYELELGDPKSPNHDG